ncbi:ribonuclease t2 [Anaeramoeba flamelloides]|uniref:Ribonuclease t2 n=1 Tax=Anaeramoeba flamelloides TaxID=1746091 RepID=A0ABQ8YDC9_9EUKA|nr:ribonuclease t2 [Anaeramoeba flamelloides]
MKIINSLLLLFGIFVCVQSAIPNEFFYLRQMGPSDCIGNKCTVPSWYRQFAVHVFSARNDTYVPTNCDSNYPFSLDEIQSLVPDLSLEWPDFWNFDAPEGFWKTNWEKHGTCLLETLQNEYNYFETTLILKTYLDVEEMMIENKIFPSNTTSYSYDQYDNAIIRHTLKKPTIHCTKWGNKIALHEFGFCFNKQLQLIDCSENLREIEEVECGDKSSIYMIQLSQ